MNIGPSSRPLLPQTAQMQPFSFAPPNLGLGDTKKNYVFVDEHNRHKRLKVMRACEGCRRRKIKCDAATTNAWPCAACVRLKLHCVPPTVNYNRNHVSGGHASGLERVLDFDNSSGGSGDEDYSQPTVVQDVYQMGTGAEIMGASQANYSTGYGAFHPPPYAEKPEGQHGMGYENIPSMQMSAPAISFHRQSSFQSPGVHNIHVTDNVDSWTREQFSAANLSEALGELKIDETGVAPYISQQKTTLAGEAAFEEYQVNLPPVTSGSGAIVRIPPALMPLEAQVTEYFEIFFTEIHPYVPVISKPYFYKQWNTDRGKISPLLLEAIFACAGRMSEDPAQGAQWLALASKHEDCFMDVPRLSTIQALLILLKARESAPKRGYYYRSWMTIKTLISMAKDLELHEHYADHQEGRSCGSDPTECLVKTRIWQTIYICEMMVAGPQGRYDMGVGSDTVEYNVQQPSSSNVEDSDYQVSWQFTYLVTVVRNVRILNDIYAKIRKQKDWGSSPRFVGLNPLFPKWLEELPPDLQIHYPPDGSPPWLPSHFVGNVHCYYHLTIVMLHRPQLMASSSFSAGGSWKQHMALCYSSAKSLCRLQEALFQRFGLNGLLCMQRGINFAIYCILTCTMLHLVAITSPDPEFNSDAKEYFKRHMRILESCTSAWPLQEMQIQIQSLRQAFSADINKPFELKPSFPFSSPVARLQPSPPADLHYQQDRNSKYATAHDQPSQLNYHAAPITPPISAGLDDTKDGSMAASSLAMMATGQRHHQQMPISHMEDDRNLVAWDPTRIFDQWNTAFGTPASSISTTTSSITQQSPTLYTASTASSHDLPHLHDATQQQHYPLPTNITPVPHTTFQQPTAYTSAGPSFVTPSMWQDTVASTYDSTGLKRRWDVGASYFNDSQQVKRPR